MQKHGTNSKNLNVVQSDNSATATMQPKQTKVLANKSTPASAPNLIHEPATNSDIQKSDNLRRMQQVQQKKMTEIINLPQESVDNTHSEVSANRNKTKWSEVTSRGKTKTSYKRLGTGKPQDDTFTGANRMVWLYLYRIKSASEERIRQFISNKEGFKNVTIQIKEIPGDPNRLKRFMLGAPIEKKDDLYNTEFWPANVGIKRFNFHRHQEFLSRDEHNFLEIPGQCPKNTKQTHLHQV